MRVLHVLCDAADGGAERLVLQLARGMRDPIRAEIATVHEGGPLSDALGAVFSAHRRRGTPGVRALVRLARFVRAYDLVHTHLWAGDTWGRPAAALSGVPCVSTAHNVDRDEPAWKGQISALTARSVRRMFAVSEAVRDHVVRVHGASGPPVQVIPNGVDLARFAAPWAGQRGNRVLFVGRLVPQKGVDVLAEAARSVPEALVEVVGDGPLHPSGLAYVGASSAEDVAQRLRRARVAVVPSRWEGFSLFAAEALAAGTPVIASDVDGLAEVVGDAGVLVPPGDAQALARALRSVLSDDALAARLSAAGRERAGRFSLENTVEAYRSAYADVVDLD